MSAHRLLLLVLLGGLVASTASAQPEAVPRLTQRTLDHATYVELAKQWKQYMDENGETAEGLVNMGLAYDYSKEMDAATRAARRAVEIDPDDPRALEFLAKMLSTYVGDRDRALELLQRCRKIAPEYGYGLTTLAAVYLFRGQVSEANEVFETIFEQGVISRPLQDYAYNMLVGLPKDAVLITAGDNDTYGPLALQAGLALRTDVLILNRSLLNVPEYAKAMFDRRPDLRPAVDVVAFEATVVDGTPVVLSDVLLRHLVEDGKAPVYLTASASTGQYYTPPDMQVEGINFRATGQGLTPQASADLFLDRYRLDSATDWNYPWSMAPNVANLLSNYVAAMIHRLDDDGLDATRRARLIAKASELADFHELTTMSLHLQKLDGR